MKQPNIVIFNPDSYRGDVLGHLGNPGAVTPNLDALIRDGGVSYANAFAQNPVCTPSRCSFMTGWYLHTHGHRSMKNMLNMHEPSLFSVLRREGYHVWWGGKNDLFAVEQPDDYLNYCDTKYWPPDGDLPSLDALREAYGAADMEEDAWVDLKRVYYAMCAKVDHQFGLVVEALKVKGIYDDALIVFLSDHGDFAGDYSLPEKTHMSLQDALIRAPFLIKPPASLQPEAGIRTHLTELVDMTATIYDLLDVDPGYAGQGLSLVPSLRGDSREIRDAVFAEVGSRANEQAFKNLDVKRLPPGSFYAVQSQAALVAHDAGSYAVSCRSHEFKYVRRGYLDHHEFYDLRNDPGELNNLSGSPAHAEAERTMERRLLDFFMTTADVLPFEQDSRMV